MEYNKEIVLDVFKYVFEKEQIKEWTTGKLVSDEIKEATNIRIEYQEENYYNENDNIEEIFVLRYRFNNDARRFHLTAENYKKFKREISLKELI